jgi:hypothetical protein|tara:strand:- start:13920 stop:14102 length:183 start_codon:yes stop_codon:yes gene_type:complete
MKKNNLNIALLALASFLLPGLGHLLSGSLVVGALWLGVYILILSSPVVCIASAVHYLVDA